MWGRFRNNIGGFVKDKINFFKTINFLNYGK